MTTAIDAALSLKSENIVVQKKALVATAESSQSGKLSADQWSPMYQMLSVATIMYMVALIVAKQCTEARSSTLRAQLHNGQAFIDQAASALKDQLHGLDTDLASNLGINGFRVGGGVAAVAGAIFGPAVGAKYGISAEAISRITAQGNLIETGGTAHYLPGQTEAQQISRTADLKLTLNSTTRDTRERLAEFTRQMDTMLAKGFTALQESFHMLSRVFQVR